MLSVIAYYSCKAKIKLTCQFVYKMTTIARLIISFFGFSIIVVDFFVGK